MHPRTVLVAGGNGFLGSSVLHRGFTNVENLYSLNGLGVDSLTIRKIGVAEPSFRNARIKDLKDILLELKPNVVINCSGLIGDEKCAYNPDEAFRANSRLAGLLAEFSNLAGAKLVHFSTDAVFGQNQKERIEGVTPTPDTIYGISKLQGEKLALEKARATLIIRTNFYGFNFHNSRGIFNFYANDLTAGKMCTGYDFVEFNPIYIGDLINSTEKLIEENAEGIIHLSGEEKLSKYQFGLLVAKELGVNLSLLKRVTQYSKENGFIRTNMLLNSSFGRSNFSTGKSLNEGIQLSVKDFHRRSYELPG